MFKQTTVFFASGLIALSVAAQAQKETPAQPEIVISTYEFPAFVEAQPDGQLGGFDVDWMRAICAKLQWNCRFEEASTFRGIFSHMRINIS